LIWVAVHPATGLEALIMKSLRRWLQFAALAFVAGQTMYAAPAYRYVVGGVTLTDLGTLGGGRSIAFDVNNAGNVVGWADTAQGRQRAALFAAGSTYDIGGPPNSPWSEARGINNHDQVVGTYQFGSGRYAFRWASGVHGALYATSPFGDITRSSAVATSDSGYIVGQRIFSGTSYSEATLWVDNDTFYSLNGDTYPWSSMVSDVNVYGDAVGVEKSTETARRWRLMLPVVESEPIPGVAFAEGAPIEPLGVNVHGHAVGRFRCCSGLGTNTWHAWYWDGYSPASTDLGVLPSGTYASAEDINDGGFIVGYGDRVVPPSPPFFPGAVVEAAFIRHPDFGIYVLPAPTLAWNVAHCRAHAVNERQTTGLVQVVGYCDFGSGPRAVRWDVTVLRRSILPPSPSK
jgi:probable HAF family extracellular repeat protein